MKPLVNAKGQVVGAPSPIARAISRRLKAAGWVRCDTRDRSRWTEGTRVHRIGVSRTVAVDYHIEWRQLITPEQRARRADLLALVRFWGYPVDERGWLDCSSYDSSY